MSFSPEFRDFVLEQLERVLPVTSRSMFGGVGIYSEGLFFALIAGDVLYLKVDDTNRGDFEDRGMMPFRPYPEATSMGYYELPGELLEDHDALRPWVLESLEVARRKARAKRR